MLQHSLQKWKTSCNLWFIIKKNHKDNIPQCWMKQTRDYKPGHIWGQSSKTLHYNFSSYLSTALGLGSRLDVLLKARTYMNKN